MDPLSFGGFRSPADDLPEPWRRWAWFWGPRLRAETVVAMEPFGEGRHFGVQARACPWGSTRMENK